MLKNNVRQAKLTLQIQPCIPDGVGDRFNRYDSRDPSMEHVICSKIPAGQPKENIITASKKPKNRHVCHRQDTGSIRHNSEYLHGCAITTRIGSQHSALHPPFLNDDQCVDVLKVIFNGTIKHRREDDVDAYVYENENRRKPCWHCACVPADRLLMFIAKSCGKCNISSNQPTDPTLSCVGLEPAASLRISVCSACRIMYHRRKQPMANPDEEYDSPEIIHCLPVMSPIKQTGIFSLIRSLLTNIRNAHSTHLYKIPAREGRWHQSNLREQEQ